MKLIKPISQMNRSQLVRVIRKLINPSFFRFKITRRVSIEMEVVWDSGMSVTLSGVHLIGSHGGEDLKDCSSRVSLDLKPIQQMNKVIQSVCDRSDALADIDVGKRSGIDRQIFFEHMLEDARDVLG